MDNDSTGNPDEGNAYLPNKEDRMDFDALMERAELLLLRSENALSESNDLLGKN